MTRQAYNELCWQQAIARAKDRGLIVDVTDPAFISITGFKTCKDVLDLMRDNGGCQSDGFEQRFHCDDDPARNQLLLRKEGF